MNLSVIKIIVVAAVLTVETGSNLAKERTYLSEGSVCVDDGYPGICILYKKCFTIIVDRLKNKFPAICSFNGKDPIVCCTSCQIVEDISRAVIDHTGGVLWTTGQKSWNQCIDYYKELPYEGKDRNIGNIVKFWNATLKCFVTDKKQEMVMGGRDARRNEFPHMALLGYVPAEDGTEWQSGGTIISDRFILTAGHCTSSSSLGSVKYAALGILKRSDPEDLWQRYSIKRNIPHPQYRPNSKYNDIALLETAKRLRFQINVLPACLPDLSKEADDDEATATGWGRLGPMAALADTLQAVRLNKFNQTTCSQLYGKHKQLTRGYDHATQMCYGVEGQGKDSCDGDSGGPLQIEGQAAAGPATVIGVTSFGSWCGLQAGVYTRVKPYVPWIDSIVWPFSLD